MACPERLESRQVLAAVNFTGAAYTQTFDTLGASATTWANDSTLAAWSLFDRVGTPVTAVTVGNGLSNSGSFYNFGTTSGVDRSLGAVASGGTYFGSPANGALAGWMAVAVTNNTGAAQGSFVLRYDGEQWRNGGAGTAQKLSVDYGYGSTFATVASWTAAGAAFDFTSPQIAATAAALDGNAAANRVAALGGTVTPATAWAAGSTLWIRWADVNDSGNDHGLAIDNVSFSIPTTVVTPPSAPTITGVTAGDSRLTVAFTSPASDGGGAVTGYQYSLDDGGTWLTPSPAVTSSPMVIGGLLNGTDYDVRIRAVNSAGPGTASAAASGRPVGTGSLRIVNYNITAADQLPRAGLATLVQAMAAESVGGRTDQVDLLTIQEVQSQAVTSANVAATLNGIYGAGTYAHGTLNGATTGSGTQGVVYNTAALRLLEERAIGTASSTGGPRQTIRYAFQPKDGNASSVFYVYNSHLKSLDTAGDAARRDSEATAIRADADSLAEGTNILYVGDFNLYRSSEAAYQTFLSAGPGQAFDPISRPGDWHSNSSFVDIFTQAPLGTAPNGLTGGGLDDRFDFQIVSGEVMAPGGLTYVTGTYRTFGNNGSVPRNGDINDPRSTALAGLANRSEVLNYLTTFSDHLPVVADYTYDTVAAATPTLTATPGTLTTALTTTYGAASASATFVVSGTGLTGSVTVTAPAGLEVSTAAATGYSSSLTLAPVSGTVATTTVYARLAASASAGTYDSQSIVVAGGGASPKTVSTTASGNSVSKASQAIAFGPLPTKVVGAAPFPLTASASSGLAVSYASSNPAVATVSGSTVTIVAAGTCTITASQAGDGNYTAATDVSQLLTVSSSPPPVVGDLFFSEYVEGTSNNKYLEIYNGGTAAANLADYQVRMFANGAATATQTQSLGSLTGGPATLAPGATLVLAGASAVLALPAGVGSYVSGVTAFNGDDALGLWKLSTSSYVDIFGVIGSDPGAAWTDGTATTANATLRRKSSIAAGVTVNPATFATLASEWTMFAVDTVSGLGSHDAVPPLPASLAGIVWNDGDGDGIRDQGETVLSGWTVYLDQDANGVLGAAEPRLVTGSDGTYAFTGLAAGTYRVTLERRDGWEQTSPASTAAAPFVSVASTAEVAASAAHAPAVRQQSTRSIPNDPLFANQWHLRNTAQSGGTAGEDARLPAAWDTATGSGVVIGIVDDGVQGSHPDLTANFRADLSYDYNGNDSDPSPGTGDDHGTSAAGVAAARGNNGLGVSGSAPAAGLAGIRLIAQTTSDQQEANGLTHRLQDIDIYSNSWGPNDDGMTLEAPGPLTRAALANAVSTGRGGLGSIYVWAAGNGLDANDNSNYDGYANSRYTIAVSAVDHSGRQSWYSEPGANILVASPSSGGSATADAGGIVTTDRTGTLGYNTATSASGGDYANDFGGTSSATPLVAGVVALMLEANPALGWRDVQHVLARSARKNDPGDAGWGLNGAGRWVNDKYGFGVVDAAAAVALARSWTNVAPEVSATSGTITVGNAIPDASSAGITSSFTLGADITVESVEIAFSATHASRGNLKVVLTSPSGTRSVLAEPHGDTGDHFTGWTFSTVRDWGESAAGTWTLTVSDLTAGTTGTFGSWAINVYGTPGSGYVAPPTPQLVTVAAGEDAIGANFGVRPTAPPSVVIDVPTGQTQVDTTVRTGAEAIVKQGAGTLVLGAANTHTGGVSVEAGAVVVRNTDAVGSGGISVTAGASLVLDVGGAGVTAASLHGEGLVDLGLGQLTVTSGLDVALVLASLAAGRGDGSWNGSGGIVSSEAAAAMANSVPRGVGWLENGDGSFTFVFAAPGDTNLDATVDILDAANVLAGGVFDTGASGSWSQGDTTYDGIVDILDIADFLGTGLFDQSPYRATASQGEAVGTNAAQTTVSGGSTAGTSPRDLAFVAFSLESVTREGTSTAPRRRPGLIGR
jgi:autotransporter-associated beta strand protein